MSAGHIRPRGPGAWELKIELPRLDGKRRTRTLTVRGTKKVAQQRIRELLAEIDRGGMADMVKTTTGAWLEQWLAECAHTVAPKTWQERAAYVRLHLLPALGAIPLAKLTPAAIQTYLTGALTSGRLDGKGGLSPQTVRHHERTLHAALERARRLRLIASNPADDVDAPRVEPRQMVVLRPDQQAALLAEADGTDLHVPLLLTLSTGLRRGELLGLAWANMDLEQGLLRVVQVTEQTKGKVRIKPAPKTARSRRTVTLPPGVVAALRRHRATQAEECLRLGLGKPDLLFPRSARNPAVFGTAFTRMARRIGIEAGIHDLRHTHCSDLLAAGVHPKAVSERLGHSSVAFTLERYGHTTPAMHAQAAQLIDGMLRRALGWQEGGNGGSEAG